MPGWSAALGPIEPPFAWQVRTDGHLRDGDGGVYWLLASVLPGFRSFRYPPKLFVFSALAISGLAGLGWDRLAAGRSRRAGLFVRIWLIASLVALAATWIGAGPLRTRFEGLASTLKASDEPLDVSRAIADIRSAIGHGATVAAFSGAVLVLARRRAGLAGLVAIAGLTTDLILANAYHVVTVPPIGLRTDASRPGIDPGGGAVEPFGGPLPCPEGGPLVARSLGREGCPIVRGNHAMGTGLAPPQLPDAARGSDDLLPRHDRADGLRPVLPAVDGRSRAEHPAIARAEGRGRRSGITLGGDSTSGTPAISSSPADSSGIAPREATRP